MSPKDSCGDKRDFPCIAKARSARRAAQGGIARTYSREGAKVVIADFTQAGAGAAAAELGDVDSAVGIAVDFTDDTQVDAV